MPNTQLIQFIDTTFPSENVPTLYLRLTPPLLHSKIFVNYYLALLRRILVKARTVVRESKKYYRVYLSMEYNEI